MDKSRDNWTVLHEEGEGEPPVPLPRPAHLGEPPTVEFLGKYLNPTKLSLVKNI